MNKIKAVKPLIFRFKRGETIPLTEEDFSGCFTGIAHEGGYIFKYSNTYIAIFDSDLNQAPLLAEVSLEAKAIQAEIIREAPEKIDKQQAAYDTIYVCGCENI